MNSDIFYQIGKQIDDRITFFNFVISFKGIRNKELLVKQKKIQFAKAIITYHKDGNICEKYYILPGNIREGLYQQYGKDGHLHEQFSYINNKTEGLYQYWYRNGQLFDRYNYVNGQIEGLYQSWYFGGQLKEKCYYVNDKKEGSYQKWFENGALEIKRNYVNDIIIEEEKCY
jgi:hypothetical protein